MASHLMRFVPTGFFVLLIVSPSSALDDEEPVYDGKKASVWVDTLINDASARKRALAVDALAKLWSTKQYKDSLPTIGRSLRLDSSVAVRCQAAIALGGLKELEVKGAERDLIDALGSEKESRVRKEIATAIGHFPSIAKKAVSQLTEILKDTDPATRIASAEAIAQTGADGKSAAAGLAPLLQDSDKRVRLAVVFALGRITPEGAPTIADSMARMLGIERDSDMRSELVTSLGLLGEKSPMVVKGLAGVLTDVNDDLRKKVVQILGSFGTSSAPAADALLKTAATDKEKEIRADAAHAFGSALGSGLKGKVKDFLGLLKDPDFEVRLAIIEEVGALGNELKDDAETIKVLRTRLSDQHNKVREAAALAIRRIEKKPEPKKEPDPKKEPEPKKDP
jgi:HEAT repeat protein